MTTSARQGSAGALGYHDVGGVHDSKSEPLSVGPASDQYLPWERQIHALRLVLGSKGLISSDELRRAVEAMDLKHHPLTYYEKWLVGIINILLERRVITSEELNGPFVASNGSGTGEGTIAARFSPGDIVRVRREVSTIRWRKPHLRTPGYLHGCSGTVTRVNGAFIDPSYAAYREHFVPSTSSAAPSPMRQVLYTVSFRASDVWGSVLHGDGDSDVIFADIFDCWLEKADRLEPQAHHYVSDTCEQKGKSNSAGNNASSALSHDHDHDHDHEHGHQHTSRASVEATAVERELSAQSPFADLAETLIAILVGKGALTRRDVADQLAALDQIQGQHLGAKLVARAWMDPAFKRQLLADAEAAAQTMGIGTSNYKDAELSLDPRPRTMFSVKSYPQGHTVLKVVENTPLVHNLVVCTLCSCYPVAVLGLSPDWYKSSSFRARAVAEPRALLREAFGLDIPSSVRIAVHDSTAELRYLVLPMRPAGTDGLSAEQLERIVTRDSMIGVATIVSPNAQQDLRAKL